MIECVRIIEFDAGHRLVGHESKCKMLHGHRYKCEFFLTSNNLDSIGRVIDFGVIKSVIGSWIDSNLDHNFILKKEDSELGDFVLSTFGQSVYYMDENPTAENICSHLLFVICPVLLKDYDVSCSKIKLWETPNCFVECRV